MHEGALSLMQMGKTSGAIARLHEKGGLYISVLANPTTGGVMASFAALGDLIFAEPGALIGFAGPRVIQETLRTELPEGFQTAEFLLERGFVDRIVARADLRETLGSTIGFLVDFTDEQVEKFAPEIARAAGADVLIDYRTQDFVPIVMEETGGRGADVIYDSVGGETTDRSLKCIAWNGRLLVIGFASGDIPSVQMNRVLLKNIALVGLHWSAYPDKEPGAIDACMEGLFEMASAGGIDPLVSARHPLEEAGRALSALAARKTVGKVVLVP